MGKGSKGRAPGEQPRGVVDRQPDAGAAAGPGTRTDTGAVPASTAKPASRPADAQSSPPAKLPGSLQKTSENTSPAKQAPGSINRSHRPNQPAREASLVSPETLFDLHASGAGDAPRLVIAGGGGPWLAHRKPASEPAALRLPPVTELRRFNTTRLLPSKYSESVLTRLADNEEDLALIFALDNATNERLLAEGNLRLGITARELVFGVPQYRIINAAYTHPHPQGGRFSMPYRGAWYAAFELATAKAEVLFHRMLQFAEIGWQHPEELDYDQYLADFCGAFHDLRPAAEGSAGEQGGDRPPCDPGEEGDSEHAAGQIGQTDRAGSQAPSQRPPRGPSAAAAPEPPLSADGPHSEQPRANGSGPRLSLQAASSLEAPPTAAEFAACLDPRSYIASQQLTLQLMEAGSLGVVYPSARRAAGSCIACFRPSLVGNVRKRDLYRLTWYPDRAATFVRRARPPVLPAAS